jgi:hypothetical protein
MIIQLLLISSLNVGINLPLFLLLLAHLCGLPPEYGDQAQFYFFFLCYFIIFLFPFASSCQFSSLRKKIKRKILCIISRQPHHTATVALTMRTIPMNRLT